MSEALLRKFLLFLSILKAKHIFLKRKDFVQLFDMFGKMVGLALYNQFNVDIDLDLSLFKHILHRSVCLDDLEHVDVYLSSFCLML